MAVNIEIQDLATTSELNYNEGYEEEVLTPQKYYSSKARRKRTRTRKYEPRENYRKTLRMDSESSNSSDSENSLVDLQPLKPQKQTIISTVVENYGMTADQSKLFGSLICSRCKYVNVKNA